ncbi:MEDS domain-containing protein [Pseudonocardia sp. KRD-182]|uniref:MEDS domain-containing protein n=1 Tax=Pseudonocardia oceani TaxID=2792013 RepID=UPI001C4A6694|nr:MEDS domain-containing protein [Pseudonocardia oceani]MBW0107470.1 MEDS domain-containing protein [Pseudonocardia oceani]
MANHLRHVVPPRPGDHFCAFYRGPTEGAWLMSAYLDEGLRAGQACLCVADSPERGDARSALTGAARAPERPGGLRHQHLPTDVIAPGAVLARIAEWSRTALERDDRTCARVVADMTWTAPSPSRPSVDRRACYETGVATWATTRRQSFVCLYDLDRFADVVCAVIKAHSRVWMRGVALENPYSRSGR